MSYGTSTPPLPPPNPFPNLMGIAELVLWWPTMFGPMLTSGNLTWQMGAAGGLFAAYYMYGLPWDASYQDLAMGYLVAGSVQTGALLLGKPPSSQLV